MNLICNSENECDYRRRAFIYIAITGNVVKICDLVPPSSTETLGFYELEDKALSSFKRKWIFFVLKTSMRSEILII